ncbi:MAG TPA: hypothetical protein VNN62_06580 [Methylomirabilota bacterium]|nr:hypothetical protein [Methylomirabilota bacterium]
MARAHDPHFHPPRSHRFSSAADTRRVRQLWQGIFAELLPRSTQGAAAPASPPPHRRYTQTTLVRKEHDAMQAYLTESPYYFSSKHLLPAGSVVFFSTKIRRYVHPTDGVLLDGHPRLQRLSEGESQALSVQWREALARY